MIKRKLVQLYREVSFWWFYKNFYKKFNFYTTESSQELNEIYSLRYQVYVEEYQYIDKSKVNEGKETDEWDNQSVHFIIRDLENEIAATVRLILNSKNGFPIEKNFKLDLNLAIQNRSNFAEISRLIVAKKYRRRHLMLVLIKGMYLYVKRHNITNIFSVMDEKLLPILRRIGIPFQIIGKPSLYQGYTFPCILNVAHMESELKDNNVRIYKYLIDGLLNYDEVNHKYSVI